MIMGTTSPAVTTLITDRFQINLQGKPTHCVHYIPIPEILSPLANIC